MTPLFRTLEKVEGELSACWTQGADQAWVMEAERKLGEIRELADEDPTGAHEETRALLAEAEERLEELQ